jgi:hypothetical protein
MRWNQIYSGWARHLEVLKRKWKRNSNALIAALAEAEVDLRREEILKQIRGQTEKENAGGLTENGG